MKWPKHRTSINRTLRLAEREPSIQALITLGLQQHIGTVEILEDVIALLHSDRTLLMTKLNELNNAIERRIR